MICHHNFSTLLLMCYTDAKGHSYQAYFTPASRVSYAGIQESIEMFKQKFIMKQWFHPIVISHSRQYVKINLSESRTEGDLCTFHTTDGMLRPKESCRIYMLVGKKKKAYCYQYYYLSGKYRQFLRALQAPISVVKSTFNLQSQHLNNI